MVSRVGRDRARKRPVLLLHGGPGATSDYLEPLLGEIRVPTLVVTGEHDEATPAINRTVTDWIPGARSVILPGRSHIAHAEDANAYLALLDEFFSSATAC